MNGNHDIGDKKISRFQFLKLLGASAIGYFAYRAGFINSLIRSAAGHTLDKTNAISAKLVVSINLEVQRMMRPLVGMYIGIMNLLKPTLLPLNILIQTMNVVMTLNSLTCINL